MNASIITPKTETLSPFEFASRVRALCGVAKEPMNYFVRNIDTGRMELHISKPTYSAYSAEEKQSIWSLFRWSRGNGCWISRGWPVEDMRRLESTAGMIGLTDGGYFVTLAPDAAGEKAQAEPIPAVHADPPKGNAQASTKAKGGESVSALKPIAAASIDAAEIEHALLRGSGFVGGKFRIFAFYSVQRTPDEAKQFLKEEYGIGGHSHTFLSGAGGFVDYDGSGMKLRLWKQDTEVKLSWISVDSYIRHMIRNGAYLTADEQEQFNAIVSGHNGKAPTPAPRMHYPPAKTGV